MEHSVSRESEWNVFQVLTVTKVGHQLLCSVLGFYTASLPGLRLPVPCMISKL